MTLRSAGRRVVALIDGEHYAPVVAETLASLDDNIVAAVLVGGTEKLRGGENYGVPLVGSLTEAIAEFEPEVVLDLSDEPVLGPRERFALASEVLAHGLPYEGPDFRFEPPELVEVSRPTLAVIGTGKRVGKTAVTGHVARLVSQTYRTTVVAMGRGGPAEPELVLIRPTVESLVELSRTGRHACSDHLETALVTGVETVGCRRCGGGLAGKVARSNVLEGVELACTRDPELIVLDASGAAVPPIAASSTLLVVGGNQDPDIAAGYLNRFRALLSDAVVVTMCEDGPDGAVVRAISAVVRPGTPVIPSILRPRPLESIAGERIAWFGTAPRDQHETIGTHLERSHGARVRHLSSALADRARLRDELAHIDADVFVVELKAGAVDVVVEEAMRRDVRVVIAANDVIPLHGEAVLDEVLERLAAEAVQHAASGVAP